MTAASATQNSTNDTGAQREHQVGSARRKQVPKVRALLLRRTCWNFFLIQLVSAYKFNRAVGTVFTFRAY